MALGYKCKIGINLSELTMKSLTAITNGFSPHAFTDVSVSALGNSTQAGIPGS
jgi:hypothetical protein